MIITARVPLRVSFGGGGTDIISFSEKNGGVVLTSTINKYAYCSIVPNETNEISIYSFDFNKVLKLNANEYIYDGNMDIVKAALKFMNIKSGCKISIKSDVGPGTGLGASSAIMAALLGALMKWKNVEVNKSDLARFAYEVEREELKIAGGYQDPYATTFGGFNFIEFNKNQNVIVKPLNLKNDVIRNLENNLLLCYTGKSHVSSNIIKDQVRNYEEKRENVMESLFNIKTLAYRMKDAIMEGELESFGEMLDEGWNYKKKLSTMITNPLIDNLYTEALTNGALGGKLLGAGDGGYLLIYTPANLKHKVSSALIRTGGKIENWNFEFDGAQIKSDEYKPEIKFALFSDFVIKH